MTDQAPEGFEDHDIRVEISHLREPFVEDLRGVILAASKAVQGGTPREAFDGLTNAVMALVDMLAYEIVNSAIGQIAEQLGGEVIADPTFDDEMSYLLGDE